MNPISWMFVSLKMWITVSVTAEQQNRPDSNMLTWTYLWYLSAVIWLQLSERVCFEGGFTFNRYIQAPSTRAKKQSFFFCLPRHCFKNICVQTDPLKTTENTVVHIPAYRCHLTFREEDTEHARKAFALYFSCPKSFLLSVAAEEQNILP